jgi:hypothetical protein
MSLVARLPVQHRKYSHCATCDRELKVFDHLHMSVPADLKTRVLRVTLQVECECGAQWCLATEAS